MTVWTAARMCQLVCNVLGVKSGLYVLWHGVTRCIVSQRGLETSVDISSSSTRTSLGMRVVAVAECLSRVTLGVT